MLGLLVAMSMVPNLILDVDMASDVDDVCAIRVADVLDDIGLCNLEAVTSTIEGNETAIDGLLDYDGKNNVSVGSSIVTYTEDSSYLSTLAEYSDNSVNLMNALDVYKSILRNDDNVVIVSTGYTSNVAEALRDEECYKLIKNHCAAIYIQGGNIGDAWDINISRDQNVIDDTMYIYEHSPVPLYFISNSFAKKMQCGNLLQELDTERKDPVTKALYAWGSSNGRTAWDPMAVFIAVAGPKATGMSIKNITLNQGDMTVYFNVANNDDKKCYFIDLENDDVTKYVRIIDCMIANKFIK